MNILFLLSLFAIVCERCQSAKILGVFNHPGASHTILGKALLKKLAEKGHEVTMISAFPLEKPMKNYRDIYLTGFLEDLKRRENLYVSNPVISWRNTKNMTLQHTMDTFENTEVKQLLKSKETFDVVIIDYIFNEATLMFGHRFQAPVILMCSFGNNILLDSLAGNSLPMAYVPGGSLPFSDDMSFKQRLIMALITVILQPIQHFRMQAHEKELKKYFDQPPTMDELKRNVALILSNSHFTLETPRPYTPNIIPVGGMHVEEPEVLRKDLKQFLDESTDGVVFFSLGSQIKSTSLGINVFESLSRAFSRIPQRVLWKWDDKILPNVSQNVRLEKWLPQTAILAHPNVKVFVTHGGGLSTIEAVYFGVPMLFIPFNGDQPMNAAFGKTRGFGEVLTVNEITEDKMVQTLDELCQNARYMEKAKYFSSLMSNQPMKPMDTAIYWVEHVIKYKGAPHLRPFSLNLSWYQYYMIDVILCVILVPTFILCLLTFLTKKVFRYLFSKVFTHVSVTKKNK